MITALRDTSSDPRGSLRFSLSARQVDKLVYLVDIRFDALVANGLGVQPFAIHR